MDNVIIHCNKIEFKMPIKDHIKSGKEYTYFPIITTDVKGRKCQIDFFSEGDEFEELKTFVINKSKRKIEIDEYQKIVEDAHD